MGKHVYKALAVWQMVQLLAQRKTDEKRIKMTKAGVIFTMLEKQSLALLPKRELAL